MFIYQKSMYNETPPVIDGPKIIPQGLWDSQISRRYIDLKDGCFATIGYSEGYDKVTAQFFNVTIAKPCVMTLESTEHAFKVIPIGEQKAAIFNGNKYTLLNLTTGATKEGSIDLPAKFSIRDALFIAPDTVAVAYSTLGNLAKDSLAWGSNCTFHSGISIQVHMIDLAAMRVFKKYKFDGCTFEGHIHEKSPDIMNAQFKIVQFNEQVYITATSAKENKLDGLIRTYFHFAHRNLETGAWHQVNFPRDNPSEYLSQEQIFRADMIAEETFRLFCCGQGSRPSSIHVVGPDIKNNSSGWNDLAGKTFPGILTEQGLIEDVSDSISCRSEKPGTIDVYDKSTTTKTSTFALSQRPFGVGILPDGNIFVLGHTGQLFIADYARTLSKKATAKVELV